MNILLTGGSSFSGLWFAEALAERGHTITAILLHPESAYQEMRKIRVKRLRECSQLVFECAFGSDFFFQVLETKGPFNLVCHHAADVTNYKSPDFDFAAALKNNTRNIKKMMEQLKAQNCKKVLLTGSVFEQREGFGSDPLSAASPYGLSKGLTSDVFMYYAELYDIHLGKFVIPNPYGPYEEKRFTSYLANCWLKDEKATVTFPDYIRDNIPISLLAKSYAIFAERLLNSPGHIQLNPSFQPASQGTFVTKFAKEIKIRLNKPCEFTLLQQNNFSEPKVRINNDKLDPENLGWDESRAWDLLAEFYLQTFNPK